MPATKDQVAQRLADAHFRIDRGISRIFRVIGADESAELTPIKLLEVNSDTTEVGIMPIAMTADSSRGVLYPSVIIEISPDEFDRLHNGALSLPKGWQMGPELHRMDSGTQAAAI